MFLKMVGKLDISVYVWSDSFSQKNLRSHYPAEIRKPKETLLVNLVAILKRLSRNPKA